MSKGSAPQAPDPVATANAQTSSNIATANNNAALNRVDQYTPWGSSVYSINGYDSNGTPQYSQNVSLSPVEQQLFNNYTQGQQGLSNIALGMQGQVANSYASPINTSGAPGINSTGGSTSGIQTGIYNAGPNITGTVGDQANWQSAVKQAQDAAYGQQTQYLDPQFQQGQSQLDNQLANQGITRGSEAYQNAEDNFARQKQAAYGNAQMQAVQAGNAQQANLYNQALSSANLQNSANAQNFGQAQAQQQANNQAQQQLYSQQFGNAGLQNNANSQYLQQLFALRNQPLNEYNSLITGAQVQAPQFSSIPTANQANTDIAGINNSAYQNQLNSYNASQQGLNNLFSLGGTLGSAFILSDRRVKRDIEATGEITYGMPVYRFRYTFDGGEGPMYRGLMADDVAKVRPDAVSIGPDGYMRVNYGALGNG